MSDYVNVGASYDNARIPTKKKLREYMATDPSDVVFDKTSPFNGSGVIRGSEIPEGVTLVVFGPDPYTSRKWYANVRQNRAGKWVVT